MNHPDYPHIPLILSGTSKVKCELSYYVNPWLQKWKMEETWQGGTQDTYCVFQVNDIQLGPLIHNNNGVKMSFSDLDVHFHAVLLEIKRKFSSVIPGTVKVEEEYSVYRLLWRGSTLEAQNVGISQTVIKSNNIVRNMHWTKRMRPRWIRCKIILIHKWLSPC